MAKSKVAASGDVITYDELPGTLSKLSKQGQRVHAAGLCALFVVGEIEALEIAADWGAKDSERVPGILTAVVPRFFELESQLDQLLDDGVWRALSKMHEHPVQVGELAGGSYIEVAQNWASSWILRIAAPSSNYLKILADDPEARASQPPLELIIANWNRVGRPVGDCRSCLHWARILKLGIQKEINRRVETTAPRTRQLAESTKAVIKLFQRGMSDYNEIAIEADVAVATVRKIRSRYAHACKPKAR